MTAPVEQFVSPKGSCECTIPQPSIVLFKVKGHLEKPVGRQIVEVMDKMVAAQRHFDAFCDFSEMTGYDSEVRTMWTQWVASYRTRSTIHILVGSKIVSMGVSVANLALGGVLVGYTSHAMFDAALRSAKMGLAGVHRK
jgi:hypothetical protein